jgi:hypothetical protein
VAGDSDGERWTVRGVPRGYQEQATEAATRRDMKVGAWVCAAIDLALQAEREPVILMPPQGPADATADTADAAADTRLALLERAVAAAVTLASTPGVPTRFRQRANRLLREALPVPVATARRRPMLRAPETAGVCSDEQPGTA